MHTNIITKKIHRGAFLACLLAGIVFIALLACEEADISTTEDKTLPPLSYAEVTHGTVAIKNPIITGVTITGYTLAVIGEGTGTVELPTIEPTTGAITVKPTTAAGTYKITATTDGATTIKSLETMFYVTTHPTSLSILETAVETGIENFGNTADLNYIKTDAITNMTGVFCSEYENGSFLVNAKPSVKNFNGDISLWNVANVKNMSFMFQNTYQNTKAFNGDISLWNVANVTNMSFMFGSATAFESDISLWDVRKVENMYGMFYYATKFNKDISKWKVDSVENMGYMFFGSWKFDNNLSLWNVANVTNMEYMFYDTLAFDANNLEDWGAKLHKDIDTGKIDVTIENMFLLSALEKNTPTWYK